MKRTWKQIGSLLLSVCMVMTMLPTIAFAESETPIGDSGRLATPADIVVAAFDELSEDILYQGYDFGEIESQDDLDLPDALTGTDTDESPTTIEGVTWQSDPSFDPEQSEMYEFSPVLPEGYALVEGTTAPVISVFTRPEGGVQIQPLMAINVGDGSITIEAGDQFTLAIGDSSSLGTQQTYTYGTTQLSWDTIRAGGSGPYTFRGWHPAGAVNTVEMIESFDVANAANPDLLLAQPVSANAGDSVTLEFKHVMSKLDFNVHKGNDVSGNLLDLVFRPQAALWGGANVDYGNGTVVSGYSGSVYPPFDLFAGLIVAPQYLDADDLIFKVELAGQEWDCKVPVGGLTLESGKRTILDITLDSGSNQATVAVNGTANGDWGSSPGTMPLAFAADGTNPVTGTMDIGGTTAVADLSQDGSGTGWTWEAVTATLTLSTGYPSDKGIYIGCAQSDEIKLEYSGDITITTTGNVIPINCNGSLEINGTSSTLTLNNSGTLNSALSAKGGDLKISSGTLNVTGPIGLYTHNGNIIIGGTANVTAVSNGNYILPGSNVGIMANLGYDIIISGGTVNATGGILDAALVADNITITGGTIVTNPAGSDNGNVYGNVFVSGSSTNVTINGSIVDGGDGADLTVSDGNVTVTGTVDGTVTVTGGTVSVNGSPVLPSGTTYPLTIGDILVTDANKDNITGAGITSGTISYDPSTKTLTLDNAIVPMNGSSAQAVISSQGDLTVKLVGNSQLGFLPPDGDWSAHPCIGYGIWADEKEITLTGEGSLTIYDTFAGIEAQNITVDIGGTLRVEEDGQSGAACCLKAAGGTLTVKRGTLELTSEQSNGLYGSSIVIDGGSITAYAKGSLFAFNVAPSFGSGYEYQVKAGSAPGSAQLVSSPTNATYTGSKYIKITPANTATYSISVTNGTASPTSAAQGMAVTLTANTALSGQRFKSWTITPSVTFTSGGVSSQSTAFTMPAQAVTATANYEAIPVGSTPVTGITLNRTSLSLYSNTTPKTATLITTVSPSDATDQSVTWASGNIAVATVDQSGNVTAVANGTAVITVTTTDGGYTASCTVTVSTYNGGGGNGGGSGSSSLSTITTGTPAKSPDYPTTVSAPVTAAAGANGGATAVVPEKSVTDAIAKAQADAKAQGKTANGISVELSITMPKGASSLTATLPRSSLNSLVSAGVTSLTVSGSPVTVSFDNKTLAEIQKQTTGDITIRLTPIKDLFTGAKAVIGTRPAYNITISDSSGKTVTSLGSGTATLSIPYTPAIGEALGGLYAVYVNEKGVAARLDGSAYDVNSGCVMFTTNHFSVYGVGYTVPSAKFTDISSHWAKDSIDYVVGRGLLSGTSDTFFAPNTAMTRGMLVTALGRLAGVDVKTYTTNSFTDVKADSAFCPYIEWAYKKGIIQGIGNNQFAPDRAVTREEIAVIFANFAKATGYTLPVTRTATTYADASSIGSTYETAVTAMQQAGIMMGGTNNQFNPKSSATRAEVSSMLHRYIKLTIDPATAQGWAKNDAGQYLYYKNGKTLTGTQTIDGVQYFFNTNGTLKTGWIKDDSGNWHFYSGNIMLVGFWDLGAGGNNKTYYFDTYGNMVSGKWLQIDGKWYYFNADGSLAKSTKIDGYEVDENGVRKTK
ncbi:S-layer homology domain-containing protein [Anaerocolumna sp.]|uniref:S-layer homology domain-containing protein n=1 Tax=Anaerocolumna sp. TaxID=2041569 RepID=UPI0028B1F253|nr:S-layer homology domain-containing protein [Anaerocolumna sp.]